MLFMGGITNNTGGGGGSGANQRQHNYHGRHQSHRHNQSQQQPQSQAAQQSHGGVETSGGQASSTGDSQPTLASAAQLQHQQQQQQPNCSSHSCGAEAAVAQGTHSNVIQQRLAAAFKFDPRLTLAASSVPDTIHVAPPTTYRGGGGGNRQGALGATSAAALYYNLHCYGGLGNNNSSSNNNGSHHHGNSGTGLNSDYSNHVSGSVPVGGGAGGAAQCSNYSSGRAAPNTAAAISQCNNSNGEVYGAGYGGATRAGELPGPSNGSSSNQQQKVSAGGGATRQTSSGNAEVSSSQHPATGCRVPGESGGATASSDPCDQPGGLGPSDRGVIMAAAAPHGGATTQAGRRPSLPAREQVQQQPSFSSTSSTAIGSVGAATAAQAPPAGGEALSHAGGGSSCRTGAPAPGGGGPSNPHSSSSAAAAPSNLAGAPGSNSKSGQGNPGAGEQAHYPTAKRGDNAVAPGGWNVSSPPAAATLSSSSSSSASFSFFAIGPPLITSCCNVTVNLKASGLADQDTPRLLRSFEDRFFGGSGGRAPAGGKQQHPGGATGHCRSKDGGATATGADAGTADGATASGAGSISCNTMFFLSLDLSENHFTCHGIERLARWILQHNQYIRLRSLKLYKNYVGDSGAIALSEVIAAQPSPLEELHLSHNQISSVGAAAVFKSIAEATTIASPKTVIPPAKVVRSGGGGGPHFEYIYPRCEPYRTLALLPLWIRLEYNRIADTQVLLEKWESECRGLRGFDHNLKLTCFADRPHHPHGSKDPHCSPARCLRSSARHSPLLHLYSFHHQSTGLAASGLLVVSKGGVGVATQRNGDTGRRRTSRRRGGRGEAVAEADGGVAPWDGPMRRMGGRAQNFNTDGGVPGLPTPLPAQQAQQAHQTKTSRNRGETEGFGTTRGNKRMEQRGKAAVYAPACGSPRAGTGAVGSEAVVPGDDGGISAVPPHQPGATRAAFLTHSRGPTGSIVANAPAPERATAARPAAAPQQSTVGAPIEFDDQQELAADVVGAATASPATSSSSDLSTAALAAAVAVPPEVSLDARPAPLPQAPESGQLRKSYNRFEISTVESGKLEFVKQKATASPVAVMEIQAATASISEPSPSVEEATGAANRDDGLPLYVFIDASAFVEMRRMRKGNQSNLFSFPGIYSVCQKRAFCYSSMAPIYYKTTSSPDGQAPTRSTTAGQSAKPDAKVNVSAAGCAASAERQRTGGMGPSVGTNPSSDAGMTAPQLRPPTSGRMAHNKTRESQGLQKLDTNQSLILMILSSVEEGLVRRTEAQPFLRGSLQQVYSDFVESLALLGVVESVDDVSGSGGANGVNWMSISDADAAKAKAMGVPADSLRVIDFAFVWTHHLSQVSRDSNVEALKKRPPQCPPQEPRPTDCTGQASGAGSNEIGGTEGAWPLQPCFSVFVTCSPKVEKFFTYLVSREASAAQPRAAAQGHNASGTAGLDYRPNVISSSNLVCLNLDVLNTLMSETFPMLSQMLSLPGLFDQTDEPLNGGKEIISALSVREMVKNKLPRFRPSLSVREDDAIDSLNDPSLAPLDTGTQGIDTDQVNYSEEELRDESGPGGPGTGRSRDYNLAENMSMMMGMMPPAPAGAASVLDRRTGMRPPFEPAVVHASNGHGPSEVRGAEFAHETRRSTAVQNFSTNAAATVGGSNEADSRGWLCDAEGTAPGPMGSDGGGVLERGRPSSGGNAEPDTASTMMSALRQENVLLRTELKQASSLVLELVSYIQQCASDRESCLFPRPGGDTGADGKTRDGTAPAASVLTTGHGSGDSTEGRKNDNLSNHDTCKGASGGVAEVAGAGAPMGNGQILHHGFHLLQSDGPASSGVPPTALDESALLKESQHSYLHWTRLTAPQAPARDMRYQRPFGSEIG